MGKKEQERERVRGAMGIEREGGNGVQVDVVVQVHLSSLQGLLLVFRFST